MSALNPNQSFSLPAKTLEGKKLLLAISGGVDSMVLAHLLINFPCTLSLAHANFGLRGKESDEDEAFVHQFAREHGLKVFVKKFDTANFKKSQRLSTQEAARKLRYDWFEKIRTTENYDFILTAHHLDDSLETFLINLSRGTGLEGLLGIPSFRNHIVRPLANVTRKQIEAYARQHQLQWREDSSNLTDAYLRNRIRHQIVPLLKALHPSFDENFSQTLSFLNQTAQITDAQVADFKKNHFIKKGENIHIPIECIKSLEPRSWWLFQLFKNEGFTDWHALNNLIDAQAGKKVTSADYRLIKDREFLILTPQNNKKAEKPICIDENTGQIDHPLRLKLSNQKTVTKQTKSCIVLDKDKLKFPLKIRRYQTGDYFYPSGMKGKKKLSKFFKDEKYSLPEKENTWLLTSENEIVWVIGKRADRRFLADDKTGQFYTLTVLAP